MHQFARFLASSDSYAKYVRNSTEVEIIIETTHLTFCLSCNEQYVTQHSTELFECLKVQNSYAQLCSHMNPEKQMNAEKLGNI